MDDGSIALAVASSNVATVICEADGTLTYVNPAFVRMSGGCCTGTRREDPDKTVFARHPCPPRARHARPFHARVVMNR